MNDATRYSIYQLPGTSAPIPLVSSLSMRSFLSSYRLATENCMTALGGILMRHPHVGAGLTGVIKETT
jgi:hypothetical protein